MIFNQYPYLNVNDLNLDYILSQIKVMMNEVTNFVSINAIKYADPIQWNITKQYEKNTIVIDPVTGTAYISVAPVPAGVALTRPEYWTVVFDLGSFVTRAAQNFTDHWESETTLTATFSTSTGGWLVWGDVLYRALTNITAGDTYVVGGNIEHFTIEDLYNAYLNTIAQILAMIGDLTDLQTSDKTSVVDAINEVVSRLAQEVQDRADADTDLLNEFNTTIGNLDDLQTIDKTSIVNAINSAVKSNEQIIINVMDYGAKGDGTTDDTDALNAALADGAGKIVYFPSGTYIFTTALNIVSYTHVVLANDAVLKNDIDNLGIFPRAVFFGNVNDSPTAYNGVHDCIFEGGTVDKGYSADFAGDAVNHMGVCMALWHCHNIIIKNVTFKNTYNDHMIELNSSENVIIENCRFVDGFTFSNSLDAIYEAINTDWATSVNAYGGANDETCCNNVIIENCVFDNVYNCIGSHNKTAADFTDYNRHFRIKVSNCYFTNIRSTALNIVKWQDCEISNCNFKNISLQSGVNLIELWFTFNVNIDFCSFELITCNSIIVLHSIATDSAHYYYNYYNYIRNCYFRTCTCGYAAIYFKGAYRCGSLRNSFSHVTCREVFAIQYAGQCDIENNVLDVTPFNTTSDVLFISGSDPDVYNSGNAYSLIFRSNKMNNGVGYDYDVRNSGVVHSGIIEKVYNGTATQVYSIQNNIFSQGNASINGVTLLWTGNLAAPDAITVNDNLKRYSALIISTTSSGAINNINALIRPWLTQPQFNPTGSDNKIAWLSENGINNAEMTDTTTINVTTLADNIRAIYGVVNL